MYYVTTGLGIGFKVGASFRLGLNIIYVIGLYSISRGYKYLSTREKERERERKKGLRSTSVLFTLHAVAGVSRFTAASYK